MDHLAAPAAPDQDTFEGWTLAAALAARTTTIRIGHLVTCDPFRHPALLAKMAATLDVISDGRLELGIGWGSVPEELTLSESATEPPADARRVAARIAGDPRPDVHRRAVRLRRRTLHVARRDRPPDPHPGPRPPVHIGGAGPS